MKCVFRVLVCALLPFVIASAVLAQTNTPPPTAVRWDLWSADVHLRATPGPQPQVYKLGLPLNSVLAMDVDEIGRIHVSDGGRQVIARFKADGSLDKQWRDDIHYAIIAAGRIDLRVLPGERIFLGGGIGGVWNIRRIGPMPTDNGLTPIPGNTGCVMAATDGSFYTVGPGKYSDGPDETKTLLTTMIYGFSPDGQPKPVQETHAAFGSCVGPADLVYSFVRNGIQHIEVCDLAGKKLRDISLTPVFGQSAPSIDTVRVDHNGDIYLMTDNIYRVDQQGNPLARWYPYRPSTHLGYRARFLRMAVARGLVYTLVEWGGKINDKDVNIAPDPSAPVPPMEIQVFTSQGQCIARYINPTLPLSLPSSVAVQSDGSYAVVQRGGPAIAFGADGKTRHGFTPAQLQVTTVVAHPNGGYLATCAGVLHLYDKDGLNGQLVYDTDPKPGGADNVWQVAIDPMNQTLWSLGWLGMLNHISPDYKLLKAFPENRELNFKTFSVGMAVDHAGYIYLPNAYGHCIVKLDSKGNIIRRIGKEGSGVGELKYPEGIIIDSKDRIYVADSGNCRIQVFAADGTPLGVWGHPGRGNGEFDRPYGLAFGPNSTLWIADTFNDRIVRTPLKEFWASLGKEAYFEPIVQAPVREPAPTASTPVVYGVVVAGTDDFDDVVYVEDPYRCWAVQVMLPKGTSLKRGVTCKIWGKIEIKDRQPVRLYADKVEIVTKPDEKYAIPSPHGMDAMYIGDGYRNGDKAIGPSNLGMLVRSWVKVVKVERENKLFTVNDGTFDGGGLVVSVDNVRDAQFVWPEVGQNLAVCGVSISWKGPDGKLWSGMRVREQDDVVLLRQ